MHRDELLQVILIITGRAGRIPSRQEIEDQIDRMLASIPSLKGERAWIISKALEILVTEVREAEVLVDHDNHEPWLPAVKPRSWASWPWLKLYLAHSLRRPPSVIHELDNSTDLVMNLLEDPSKEGIWDRRGLVMGHVQSGKTQHYTALAAKAIDAGYKVIIILSGIHENLRQQTQERIEECISGKNSRESWKAFGIRTFQRNYRASDRPDRILPDIGTLTSIAGDYGAVINKTVDIPLGNIPVVLVVKKNVRILRNVLGKLRGSDKNLSFQKAPVLVIDDEADHSGVDTNDEDTDPTRINELIRKLLWCCDRVSFVGYTATPYANIYMDDVRVEKTSARAIDDYGSDLFPHAFIISLKAPNNYVGPELVFGREADSSVGISEIVALPMAVDVKDAETWIPPQHRKSHLPQGMPDSLKRALQCFVLSIAARMASGDSASHCSMLVHVTRFNDVQERVMAQISAYLEITSNTLLAGPPTDRKRIRQEFESLWSEEYVSKFPAFKEHPSQMNDSIVLPVWQDVENRLNDAFAKLTCTIVNSLTKENLNYAGNDHGLVVVAVGGDRLSRGLTLEGLTISYFHRGARAYDTLMQMGRWFGYRPRYAHLCRVFAPHAIISNFRKIILATEELRREFSRMIYLNKTPREYGLRIREPRGDLMVTALNKRRSGMRIKVHFAESLISSLDMMESDLQSNLEAFQKLLKDIITTHGDPVKSDAHGLPNQTGSWRIWREVEWASVGAFLRQYNAITNACLDRSPATGTSLLYDYVDSVSVHGELVKWTIAVIGAGNGVRLVPGMDPAFRAVSRNRLMHEFLHCQPENLGRVAFQGVALGSDEAVDLTPEQRASANQKWLECKKAISLAAFHRAARPSTHGLLLIYPIIPATPKAAELTGEQDTHYQWIDKDPIIGIAVSLPASEYDAGCVYVCNRQKKREMFGEVAEDSERDEEESWDHAVPPSPRGIGAKIYNSLLEMMGLAEGVIPKLDEDPVSLPYRVVRGIHETNILLTKEAQKRISKVEIQRLGDIIKSFGSEQAKNDSVERIIDLLGCYDSAHRKVVLYTRAIELFARAKSIPYESLYLAVLCHQLAHAASHLGLDASNRMWAGFEQSSPEDREFFAQIYATRYLAGAGMRSVIEVIRDFNDLQLPKCSERFVPLDAPLVQINELLMQVRMK
jgi:hypothetical protein